MTAVVRRVLLVAVVFAVLGVLGGVLWNAFATPTTLEVQSNGIVLTEDQAGAQFGVIATYVGVVAVLGLVSGVVAGLVLRRPSPWNVLLVVAAGLAASWIAFRLGSVLGPAAPGTVKGLKAGGTVPDEYRLDTFPPFLVWSIVATFGYAVLVALRDRDRSAGDVGHHGLGDPYQVAGGQPQVEPTPPA